MNTRFKHKNEEYEARVCTHNDDKGMEEHTVRIFQGNNEVGGPYGISEETFQDALFVKDKDFFKFFIEQFKNGIDSHQTL
jgi:hypothetical protein